MSDSDEQVCPLCCEELDISDQNFLPCKCGYQARRGVRGENSWRGPKLSGRLRARAPRPARAARRPARPGPGSRRAESGPRADAVDATARERETARERRPTLTLRTTRRSACGAGTTSRRI